MSETPSGPAQPEPYAEPEIHVQADATVSPRLVAYTREKLGAAIRHAHEPVLYARVRLLLAPDPATARPARAQANLDLNGRPVRVQVVAETLQEAVDELEARLGDRVRHLGRTWEDRRGAVATGASHEWRHGNPPRRREDFFPRPVEEREVVRHKTFTLMTSSVDEAAFDMDLLDYDFHLFTELETGQDAVLYRVPEGHRLSLLDPDDGAAPATAVPVSVSRAPAVVLDVAGAIDRLGATGQPFVFFRDAATGRGSLLYHRYDGHYGLITPAD